MNSKQLKFLKAIITLREEKSIRWTTENGLQNLIVYEQYNSLENEVLYLVRSNIFNGILLLKLRALTDF